MEWITIIAIILGPILAVQVQQFLQKWKEKRDQQLRVFSTLMATRANTLSVDHVNALNWIDLAFSKKNSQEKDIVEAWEKLLDHYLKGYPKTEDFQDTKELQSQQKIAADKSTELRVTLIKKMADFLKYDLSETHIKNGCYSPSGHLELENDQWLLRKALLGVLDQKLSIPMNVVSFPATQPDPQILESIKKSEENHETMIGLLEKLANEKKM